MSLADGVPNEHAVIRDKAIKYIKENWGTLDGLPSDFIPVVWVTVFRALETGSQVPNSQVLLKDQLLNQGKLTLEPQPQNSSCFTQSYRSCEHKKTINSG